MGCFSSKSGKDTLSSRQRRRLTINETGLDSQDGSQTGQGGENAPRQLVLNLCGHDLMQMLEAGAQDKPKMVFEKDDLAQTFEKKKDELGKVEKVFGLGLTCRKGLKPEAPNQDSLSIVNVDDKFCIYGIYDGFGSYGHDVSNLVKATLFKIILQDRRFNPADYKAENMLPMMKEAFAKMQDIITLADSLSTIKAGKSGTTATVVIQSHVDSKLFIAHVGDSSVVIGKKKDGRAQGRLLTRRHTPDLPEEKARHEKSGATVVFDGYANHRVYAKEARHPGLNMSRCLGHLTGQQTIGLSAEPDLKEYAIEDDDSLLILCSDGVMEFMTPQEAVDTVAQFQPEDAMKAADQLASKSWDQWIKEEDGAVVDDITVVCKFLDQDKKIAPGSV